MQASVAGTLIRHDWPFSPRMARTVPRGTWSRIWKQLRSSRVLCARAGTVPRSMRAPTKAGRTVSMSLEGASHVPAPGTAVPGSWPALLEGRPFRGSGFYNRRLILGWRWSHGPEAGVVSTLPRGLAVPEWQGPSGRTFGGEGRRDPPRDEQVPVADLLDVQIVEADDMKLGAHLIRLVGGPERVTEVGSQHRRRVARVALHESLDGCDVAGPEEIHDEDRSVALRAGCDRLPQHEGRREVMQQAVADDRVEASPAEVVVRQRAALEPDPIVEPGAVDPHAGQGEHVASRIYADDASVGVGTREADGRIGGTAAEVEHFARDRAEAGEAVGHECIVRFGEVSLRVGAGLLGVVHQLRLRHAREHRLA